MAGGGGGGGRSGGGPRGETRTQRALADGSARGRGAGIASRAQYRQATGRESAAPFQVARAVASNRAARARLGAARVPNVRDVSGSRR